MTRVTRFEFKGSCKLGKCVIQTDESPCAPCVGSQPEQRSRARGTPFYAMLLCWRGGSGLGLGCGRWGLAGGCGLGAAPRAGPLRQRHLDLPWKSEISSNFEIRCRGGHLWVCPCGVGIRGRTGRYPTRTTRLNSEDFSRV